MKSLKINILLIALGAVLAGLSFTACEDYPDEYEVASGTPTVYYIRCLSTEVESSTDTDDTVYSTGQFVTSASPQSVLCLVGENLRSVYEMYFNDKQAVLNSSYITDNTLIVAVPNSVPEEVSNLIYMITEKKDTVTYDFEVVIPAPTISSMSCEYAQPGTTATINGNYIIDDPNVPLTITFPDGSVAEDVDVDDSYASVSFTVPECYEEGPITVTSIYGSTESSFYYLDTRGMMFEFDGVTGLTNHGWHARTITTDDTAITGNFVQLGDGSTTMDDSTWNDSQFSFEYWPGNYDDPLTYTEGSSIRLFDLVDFSDYTNMSIKFELYIPSEYPWSAGAMQIIMAGVDYVSYGNSGVYDVYGNLTAGCNNTYISGDECPRALYRPWTEDGSYDTGDEWVTVTIPISSSFLYGYSGGAATGSLSEDQFASLVIFVCSGGVSGTECTPLFKIDNIRAVPNS